MIKKIAILALALFSVGGLAATSKGSLPSPVKSAQELNRVIATVNGEPITQHQYKVFYNRAVARLKEQHQMLPDIGELHRYVLDQLIDRHLQIQMANRGGLKVSDKQVDKQIQMIMQQRKMTKPQLLQYLHKTGYTYPEFRKEVRTEILIGQVQHDALASNISMTKAQVTAEYNKIKSDPHFAAQYHVVDILVPLKDGATAAQVAKAKKLAMQLKAHLEKGASYKYVADKDDTDLGWRTLAQLPNIFADKVGALKIGGVAGPLRAPNGFHVIQLLNKKKSSNPLPSMQQVQQRLLMEQVQKQMGVWLKNLRKQSDIQIYEQPTT
jgi:peptidyl-prolyl cis-trans isomerase SurA